MTQPVRMQDFLAPPAKSAIFLVVTVGPEAEDVRDLFADVAGITPALGFRAGSGTNDLALLAVRRHPA